MRRTILGGLVVAAWVLGLALPVGAITDGEPDAARHPNVGAIVVDADWEGDGILSREFWCSGSLLAPTEFLTADHCVYSIELYSNEIKAVYVTFDQDLNRDPNAMWVIDPANLVPVVGWTGYPDVRLTVAKGYNDVAVMHLASQVTSIAPIELPEPGFLTQAAANGGLRGRLVVNVGFGANDLTKSVLNPQSVTTWYGQRWMSLSRFMALTPYYLKVLANPSATGEGGICFGDSGSPHFFSDDPTSPDYNLAVAVTSAADPNCQALSENQRLDTSVILDFLDEFVA